jgi:hypothetical protein
MLSYFGSLTVPGLERVTVFRDDEDSTQFYALPSTPRLARDDRNQLLLDLIIYARDVDKLPPDQLEAQRGWLAASVELALTEEEHNKILDYLRELLKNEAQNWWWRIFKLSAPNREPKLSLPPQFVDGTCTLTVPNPGGTVAPLGTSKPSLISTNLVTIAGDLSQDSSELMRQTVLNGGLPIAASYSLTFLARIPSIKVEITGTRSAFISETIDKFKTMGTTYHTYTLYSYNWWWAYYHWTVTWAEQYPKVNTTITSHQEEVKSITLKIDNSDFRNDPAAVEVNKEFEKMALEIFSTNVVPAILKDMTAQFDALKKKLDEQAGTEQDPNKVVFGKETLTADVSDTINITLERSSVIQVAKNPNGQVAHDLTPEEIKKSITYLDLSDPFFKELPVRVRANVNFERDPVYGLKVFLDYQQQDDRIPRLVKGSKTMLFTSADQVQSFRQILAKGADGAVKDTYHYWSEIIYKDTGQTIRVPASGVLDSRETELVISYRSLGFIQVALTLAPMPDNVVSVDVNIRYPRSNLPSASQKITLTKATPTASFFTYTGQGGEPGPYRYSITYVLADGQRMDVAEREERAEKLAISNPFEDTVNTTFVAQADFSVVDKVIVDATYVDKDNDLSMDHHAELASNGASSMWSANLRNPVKLDFTYVTTVLFKNGSSQQAGPTPGILGQTVLTGTGGTAALEVLLVPNLNSDQPTAIVQLRYDDGDQVHQEQSFRLDNSQTSVSFKVLLRDQSKRGYRYRIQLLATAAKPAWDSGWLDGSDSVLIVAPPAGGTNTGIVPPGVATPVGAPGQPSTPVSTPTQPTG